MEKGALEGRGLMKVIMQPYEGQLEYVDRVLGGKSSFCDLRSNDWIKQESSVDAKSKGNF